MSKHNHEHHDHEHHHHDDGKIMTIKEYHQSNLMLFNIKELLTTDTAVCTLTSIDRFTFLANGVEHHECKVSILDDYYKELVKRNLIAHFFDKIEIEPFDALDASIDVDFLFE
ncbi:hypothetical protein [Flavicella marina]|uniref:hypothetical protein n=1 Tax=Flavicella marina TaxID=1475951 RepID=UPI001264CFE8|nr:hypothetical protein [Flavicella marina]